MPINFEANMREVHFRVRNLSNDEYLHLRKIALQETGTHSIAALAKKILFDKKLIKQKNQINDDVAPDLEKSSRRLEIRLTEQTKLELEELAKAEGMTLNRYIVMLLHSYTTKEPVLSTNEVDAIRKSNYQLYKIGHNLNQIAKSMNAGLPNSISNTEITKLKTVIDEHMTKVHQLIDKNYDRL